MQPLQEACDKAGVTYRQGYHWLVAKGLLRGQWYSSSGEFLGDKPAGSGSRCWISTSEARVMRITAQLMRAGLTLEAAMSTARRLGRGSSGRVMLWEGVTLEWSEGRSLD